MNSQIVISGKVVSRDSIVMSDVDMRDFPDFCDAFVEEAEFVDGTPLNDGELATLTEEHGCDLAHESLY